MAKKSSTRKKSKKIPFYKKYWVGIIIGIILGFIIGFGISWLFFNNSTNESNTNNTVPTQESSTFSSTS